MPRPGPVHQFQLVPVQANGGGRGGPSPNRVPGVAGAAAGGTGGGAGAGAGAGRRRNGQQGIPKGAIAGQQGYKYTENVRNRQDRPVQPPSPSQTSAVRDADAALPVQSSEPLTIKALAAAPEEQKKQMIGERLFPLIKDQQPSLAGKITGMLLEMDNGELIHLLENREALNEKIDEALAVLRNHPAEMESAKES